MTLPKRVTKTLCSSRRAASVAAAVFVGVSCFACVYAALSGRYLTALLAVVVAGGVLVGMEIVDEFLRTAARLSSLDTLDDIRSRLDRIEESLKNVVQVDSQADTRIVDLSTFGQGDPSNLAAASLDRDVFPRLVAAMEAEPPADTPLPEFADAREASPPTDGFEHPSGEPHSCIPSAGVSTKNLLRAWKMGLRSGDLASCRSVYAALVDTVDPGSLEPLTVQLRELADRTEKRLREAFASHRGRGDYAGMLAVGEQICRLLPGRPIVQEFKRIEPHLLRALPPEGPRQGPSLRVHR